MSTYIIILAAIGLILVMVAFKTKKKYLFYAAGLIFLAIIGFIVALGFALDTM